MLHNFLAEGKSFLSETIRYAAPDSTGGIYCYLPHRVATDQPSFNFTGNILLRAAAD